MIRVACIVQARMGSTRLPGKVLLDLCGRPALSRVIERAKLIRGLDCLIVATTQAAQDDAVVALCRREDVPAWRGSSEDVLNRYYAAAAAYAAEIVVRITADCPLLDPDISTAVLERFLQGGTDYVSNVHPRTYPDGLDTEVFSFEALERAWREARARAEREHVTPYIWNSANVFQMANVAGTTDLSQHRWTLDLPADLDFIRSVYARLAGEGPATFRLADIVSLLDDDSDLARASLCMRSPK